MKKNDKHIEPYKLSVFRSFEEMKATPFSFPSTKPLSQWKTERKEAFDQLKSTFSANKVRRPKKKIKKA